MSLYNLPNSTSGIDSIAGQLFTDTEFVPFFLVFVFLFVWLGGTARQKARQGEADFSMWGIIASVTTLMFGLLLSITAGLISLFTLVVLFGILIIFAFWYFLSHMNSSV